MIKSDSYLTNLRAYVFEKMRIVFDRQCDYGRCYQLPQINVCRMICVLYVVWKFDQRVVECRIFHSTIKFTHMLQGDIDVVFVSSRHMYMNRVSV